MKHANNIFKFLRALFMAAVIIGSLSACASSNEKQRVSVIEISDNADEQYELDEQQRSCWQAEVLAAFYNVMAKSSVRIYPKVTESAMPFMMVAFAVWLAFRLLKHVSSVSEENGPVVWTEIARMAFLCLVCGLLASSTSFLLFTLNKLILPIYYAFLEYGSLVLNTMTTNAHIESPGIYLGTPPNGACLIYSNSLVCAAPPLENVTLDSFPSGPSELMQCLTCAVNDRMQLGFILAKNMLSTGYISSIVTGICLYAIFAIVKIGFVFYMVDSIFRMNIMIILLPCLILAYPFKFTRKWTKEGFLTILSSSAMLTLIAVIIAMALMAMQTVLVNNAELIGNRDLYVEFGTVSLIVLLIGFLVLKSIGLAVSVAVSLVGGSDSTNFQKKIASKAAQIGKRAFLFITGGIGKLFLKSPAAQKMKDRIDKAKQKIDEMAGRS